MRPVRSVIVAGAGLAGLSCALRLAAAGFAVTVFEAAAQAGGRTRSFHDPHLDRTLDNGSHLALSGNRALLDHLRLCGAEDRMRAVRPACFPFFDRRDGARWALRPGGLWFLDPRRRVPGGGAWAHLAALRLLAAAPAATVADVLSADGPLFTRLWEPLAVSVLNGPPDRVPARLLGAVLRLTLLRGERACRPLLPVKSLSHALVEPALARLAGWGVPVRCGARVEALVRDGGRVTGVRVAGAAVSADAVVLALPPWTTARLLPGMAVPPPGAPIVNVHLRLPPGVALPAEAPLLGVIGGTAEWLFQRGDVLSATISDAAPLIHETAGAIAARVWADAGAALGTTAPLPLFRVVKERRATFAQTPAHESLRPGPHGPFAGLTIAGDWTATGLPATMEGAIVSGNRAAQAIIDPGK